jgi:hypothetical protein
MNPVVARLATIWAVPGLRASISVFAKLARIAYASSSALSFRHYGKNTFAGSSALIFRQNDDKKRAEP